MIQAIRNFRTGKMAFWVGAWLGCVLLAGCKASKLEHQYPPDSADRDGAQHGRILEGEGFSLVLGAKHTQESASQALGITVNAYVWRAALDTVAFMPLLEADPVGGVILTDWYEDPAARGERFKFNLLILGGDLRVDSVKITAFKEKASGGNTWRSVPVSPSMARDLEDTILSKARAYKLAKSH